MALIVHWSRQATARLLRKKWQPLTSALLNQSLLLLSVKGFSAYSKILKCAQRIHQPHLLDCLTLRLAQTR